MADRHIGFYTRIIQWPLLQSAIRIHVLQGPKSMKGFQVQETPKDKVLGMLRPFMLGLLVAMSFCPGQLKFFVLDPKDTDL